MDKIKQKLKLDVIVESSNVAELLNQESLDSIGRSAVEDFSRDLASRTDWEQRSEKAIKLALQVVEQKSFPWTNCSNVKFPLLTIGALQFLARVAVLTKGKKLAKLEPIGADPDGKKFQRANRISDHISMQLLEEDPNWLDEDEKAKLAACIIGVMLKKTWYDGIAGVVVSEYVPAAHFVVDYYCKNVDKAQRITHILHMDRNAIEERIAQGLWLGMSNELPGQTEMSLLQQSADDAEGIHAPEAASSDVYQIL